jgi:hypothetical protein
VKVAHAQRLHDSVSEYYPIFPTSTSRLVGTYYVYNNGKQKNPIPRVPRGSPRYRGPLGQYDRKQHFIVSESLPAGATAFAHSLCIIATV